MDAPPTPRTSPATRRGPLARLRLPRELQLREVRLVQAVALAMFWLIVVTGATVRLTGSGLGCPNWPSCHGARPVPEADLHSLIEFGNRMLALPTLLCAIAAFLAVRRLTGPPRPGLRWGSALALVGVLLQIPLGGVTVRTHLHPLAVGSHFLLSMLILLVATVTWQATASPTPLRLGAGWRRRLPAGLLLAVCATLLVLCMLVTAAGPHSGAEATSPVVRIGHAQLLVTLHARLAFAYTALVLGLTWWFRRTSAGARDVLVLAGLVCLQIGLGEYQYRHGLPWQVVLAHVATAGLVWIATVRVAAASALVARAGAGDLATR
jgi:cytochrome c oxidase assembly protein subunit 15